MVILKPTRVIKRAPDMIFVSSCFVANTRTNKLTIIRENLEHEFQISMFHRAFFNSMVDKYQHIHFFTLNTLLA